MSLASLSVGVETTTAGDFDKFKGSYILSYVKKVTKNCSPITLYLRDVIIAELQIKKMLPKTYQSSSYGKYRKLHQLPEIIN